MYEIMDVDKNFCECYCCESLSFMSERSKKREAKLGKTISISIIHSVIMYILAWDQEGISFARQGRPGASQVSRA